MRRARRALAVVAVVAAVAGLAVLGRWEERRAADEQLAGIRGVLGLIDGAVDSKRLTRYRIGPPDCFAYHVERNPYGAQICFDSEGRVVEAVDRLGSQPRYWSVTYRPELSPYRVPRAVVDRLLTALETPG